LKSTSKGAKIGKKQGFLCRKTIKKAKKNSKKKNKKPTTKSGKIVQILTADYVVFCKSHPVLESNG